jgi:hypothetical protein
MIPYVSNFNNGYVTNVENALKDLSKAADEAITKANATATPNKDAQKNTQGNMSAKAAYVSSAVKYYSSGVINAIRDRNADYLGALNSLVPKNTNNTANQVKTDNNQQANQQQQDQAQEQQAQPAQA